eukprot:CAMPEP_0185769202 /NCGR_PEP_ID=MMETSP1174-20130828/53435_1 /TAXON_ID=35687 /ORGANISM="Dictyocha speculum, Strain CCMP1381" /LENGTH=254 /DNA_ID=CAMNT_0028454185 /DNA_START=21 /DNA_END=785 /DNA_ORIENTATION=-
MAALATRKVIGVLGAMEPEIALLKKHVTGIEEVKVNNNLSIFKGTYEEKDVVFASAGVGPIFAATTVSAMILSFKVEAVVFTGVAGGLKDGQKVGDIVIGTDCVNYDMDVTRFIPFPGCTFQRGQLPFINWLEYAADPALLELARGAPLPDGFAEKGSVVREGRIATGSVFVDVPAKQELVTMLANAGLGEPEAVEMECAAVAQVCRSFNVPFLGLRALSDTMEGDANEDFNAFTQEAADNLWPMVAAVIAGHN